MECSLRLWSVYYGIGLTLIFIIFFRDELQSTQQKSNPLSIKKSSIFKNYQSLKENCQIHGYFIKNHIDYSQPKTSYGYQQIATLSKKLPSKLLKVDLARKVLYCLSSKTGATEWSRLASAIKRNITFEDLLKNYDHDLVHEDQPTLYEVKEALKIFDKYDVKGYSTRAEHMRYKFLTEFDYRVV